jgi:acyl-CoA thioester hydrolase
MDSCRTYEVRWLDLDPNGHVRHSVYDDYAVDARFRWMEEIGFPPARCWEMGMAPVVLRQESRFYREVTIGETITVTLPPHTKKPHGLRRSRAVSVLARRVAPSV